MSSKVRSMQRVRQQPAGGMNLTLEELLLSKEPLAVLCNQETPIRTSFRLGKIVKHFDSELADFYTSQKKLAERFANKDDAGIAIILNDAGKRVQEGEKGHYDIPPAERENFNKEYQELLTTKITIPGEQFRIADLGSISLAPAHVLALGWLLTD